VEERQVDGLQEGLLEAMRAVDAITLSALARRRNDRELIKGASEVKVHAGDVVGGGDEAGIQSLKEIVLRNRLSDVAEGVDGLLHLLVVLGDREIGLSHGVEGMT
jgi:hypothetical protein